MPKSNFNQFLDECEDARTAEKTSVSKISFEMKLPPCNDECESKTNQNVHSHNHNSHVKTLNTFSSNSNTHCSSSNIFLSKSANNGRSRIDRFSTNRVNNYTNTTATTNVQTNIFKKIDDNINCFNPIPTTTSTSTSTSMSTVEINNETFPSLTSATVASETTSMSVPKKFKNFRDAICATAPAPVVAATPSPTKQKQTRALPTSAFLPPMVVKRDSEIYAKKMLAKTKNLAEFYGDHDDDDYDDDGDGDDIRDFGCSRKSKPIFINNYGDGNDSD